MLSLRGRIALTAVAASGAGLLAVLLLVGPGLRRNATEQTRARLFAEARLMARVVDEALARGAGSEELDALVDAAAREIGARVTIITPDGRVVADSSVSGSELAAVESHRDRPEVREALASGSGTAVRRSATLGANMLYAAVAVRHAGRVAGIARAAQSLEGVEVQYAELRRAVTFALGVAFLIIGLVSTAFSSSLAGPLKELMEGARQLAAGDLSARLRIRRGDELGELARIVNLSADQLQERLAESARERARTEATLTAMEEGVLAVDQRGTVLVANDALRDGLRLEDPVGRHYVEAIRQREVDAVIQEVLAYGRRRALEVEMPHLRRAFAVTGVPLIGASGAPQGAVLTFHDVTQRRRVDRIRRDFVANASHELRTPLTSVRGFVEALEDGGLADPATAGRFLGKIRTHADRMAALVEDLLELSRLESGERPPRWEEISPAEVAEEVVASFAAAAERKGTSLTLTDHGAPRVVSDADRLQRILENLVDNAVKYTPEAGRVEVVTGPAPAGGALIEVRDDGPGIPAEHIPRLFERFYRVDKARSRELGGTGLGLSIVKHLAESMGASVSVTSEPGKGSCFSVSLPASREHLSADS